MSILRTFVLAACSAFLLSPPSLAEPAKNEQKVTIAQFGHVFLYSCFAMHVLRSLRPLVVLFSVLPVVQQSGWPLVLEAGGENIKSLHNGAGYCAYICPRP